MKKYIIQEITSAVAVACLWGVLGVVLLASSPKAISEVLVLAIVGGVATYLFIHTTFITKEV